ncbi:MAG: ATP-dependent helicase, partial [Chloroflexi bacterium]
MHIIHGTWIPDEEHEFTQRGSFYLWVETDTLQGTPQHHGIAVHPRHLLDTALATFLIQRLGQQEATSGALARTLSLQYFLLPTVGNKPLPSFELHRYVAEDVPTEFDLKPWQICCYRVSDVITTLNDIHFIALHAAEDFQLGADLLFWYQYAQVLKGIIAKDQYIPAIRYRALPPPATKGKKAKSSAPSFELHPGWELLSATYETAIQHYAAAMPLVCTAGLSSPHRADLFAKEPLLRHFSECLLHDIVTGTPFTAKFDQQVMGTILYGCLHPAQLATLQTQAPTLDDYQRWLVWHAHFARAHTQAGFILCFRLEEASSADIDNWQLHFLVAAKHDPSLKLSLEDYWRLRPKVRAQAAQSFGQDFEKHLLLALGYAARIYPTVWDGLSTDQPIGCRLTMDEAFTFLKESAWVLEDAGYTVIVPAWWTPDGRKRTKIRLKTSLRKTKGAAAVGSSHLRLQNIIAYSYELSVGGQVVTENEWQQLVNAKTPLVQFRGQWMELDREKMQQLLAFWQSHQGEEPEVTLLDLMKLGAERED